MNKLRVHYKQYGRTKIAYGVDLNNGYFRIYLETGSVLISVDCIIKTDF